MVCRILHTTIYTNNSYTHRLAVGRLDKLHYTASEGIIGGQRENNCFSNRCKGKGSMMNTKAEETPLLFTTAIPTTRLLAPLANIRFSKGFTHTFLDCPASFYAVLKLKC